MDQTKKYLLIILALITVFLVYNYFLYTNKSNYGTIQLTPLALKGERVWLHNNCNACHQLYGLGGYLGPDLTNEYEKKGPGFIKAMAISGVKAMPIFKLNEFENNALVQFLKEVSQTGYFPNTSAKIKTNGWVVLHYKNSHDEK